MMATTGAGDNGLPADSNANVSNLPGLEPGNSNVVVIALPYDTLEEGLMAVLGAAQSPFDETYMLVRPDGSQVHFNVTKARSFAEAMYGKPQWFSPRELSVTADELESQYLGLDRAYALRTLTEADMQRPVLFAQFEGHTDLLDGWHRLYRALSTGRERMSCYVLTQEEADQFAFLRCVPGVGVDTEMFRSSGTQSAIGREEDEGRSLLQEDPPDSF